MIADEAPPARFKDWISDRRRISCFLCWVAQQWQQGLPFNKDLLHSQLSIKELIKSK